VTLPHCWTYSFRPI